MKIGAGTRPGAGRLLGLIPVIAILALPLALPACGGGGSKMETQQDIRTTTTGQELSDLKKALDDGAITPEEYERERKKILERSN